VRPCGGTRRATRPRPRVAGDGLVGVIAPGEVGLAVEDSTKNAAHSKGVHASTGPCRSFESRTATWPSTNATPTRPFV